MTTNNILEIFFEKKRQYHNRNSNVPFEEKVRQTIELQKIDTEFNKQRKRPRAPYMRIWRIDEKQIVIVRPSCNHIQ